MILEIPLTGTVEVEGSVRGEGLLKGADDDPIRPIDIDLGNVSWRMIDVDLENEVMIVEVSPAEEIDEPTGEVDGEGAPINRARKATPQEKTALLQHAQHQIESHTKEELYAMSKCSRLKRPFKEKE